MKIFHYHPDTLKLLGEDLADLDPLDHSNWLVPAYATKVEPPSDQIDGKTVHFIDGAWVYQDIPASEPEPVIPPLTGNALVMSQIADIESTITPRRLREAAIGVDNGWLKASDDAIIALRKKLTK